LKQLSEINLTPLMDLTFILLITFIITFPLIEQGIPVNLPRGKAKDLSPDRSRTITIDAKGAYFDDRSISHEALSETMQKLGRADPDVVIMVRADEAVPYGSVVKVLKILHDARIARMALVTRSDENSRKPGR